MPHLAATTLTGAALAALLLPAGTVLAVPAGAAVHQPQPPRSPIGFAGVLRLTVSHPEEFLSPSRTVMLTCAPATGTHPDAGAACADLERTNGHIAQTPDDTVCSLEYRQVMGKAVGLWRGRVITFRQSFPNACSLHAHTGSVFRF
ncbi:SSI family serine proteinase inhibitor [Thermomonospora umbrina]|uniref:Subtilisin inhibitor-like n=1 Tax=Thermomonospora umbrina TaxID=111806 RepID=A0A3D9SQP3_9ACTN|nr:SSI family serine proteinase inhibitor [Thermomonospora umbrina]REE96293.1 subtilisin inhibitor-like [Thermomonospora umbrina]